MLRTSKAKVLLVIVSMAAVILDPSQCQETGGLRFPNIFNLNTFSLPNIFRQQRPPVPAVRNPPLTTGPANFLQAPPPPSPVAFPTSPIVQQQPQGPFSDQTFSLPQDVNPQFPGFQIPQVIPPASLPETGFQPLIQNAPISPQFPVQQNVIPGDQQSLNFNFPTSEISNQFSNSIIPAQFALSSSVSKGTPPLKASFLQQQSKGLEGTLDCGASNDLGFCAVSEKYPREIVDSIIRRCIEIIRPMFSEVPEDYDSLGHKNPTSDPVNATHSQNDHQRPWSWAAYEKEAACDSELQFLQPGIAKDRTGQWRIIIQSAELPQRVPIDVCRNPDQVCKVFTDCGRNSRCVQRYSYHTMIAIDQTKLHECPSVRTFRFPTSCACHVEVDKNSISRADKINSVIKH